MNDEEHFAAGMAVRRKTLGDAWVDRASANIRPYNKDFQDYVTRCGWAEVWTRPGMPHKTRRIMVLATMIAIGKWDEFVMHLRPALLSGDFTLADLTEIIMQQGIYCGLPAANTALHHTADLLVKLKAEGHVIEGAE